MSSEIFIDQARMKYIIFSKQIKRYVFFPIWTSGAKSIVKWLILIHTVRFFIYRVGISTL